MTYEVGTYFIIKTKKVGIGTLLDFLRKIWVEPYEYAGSRHMNRYM